MTKSAKPANSRRKHWATIGPESKTAVPALIKSLNDSVPYVRESAAEALGKVGPEARTAVPALIKLLGDEKGDVRYWATQSLGAIEPEAKTAVPA